MSVLSATAIFKLFVYLSCAWFAKLLLQRFRSEIRKRNTGQQDPPSYPHKDPIWGLDVFFKMMNAYQNGSYLTTNASLFDHSTSKTIKTNSFGTTLYRTYDSEVSKCILSTYFKSFGMEPLRSHIAKNLWGNSIVVSDGKRWADARSFIRSSFDVVHTANIDRLRWHVDRFMKLLPENGETVDLMPLFKRLILDTSSEFIFGESLNALEDPSVKFMDAFGYAQRGTGIRVVLGKLKIFHRDKKWFESCRQVTDFCDRRVDDAFKRMEKGEERRTERDRLRMVDEAAKATNDRYTLRSLVLGVFSPAHDGAAIALTNAFFHLARHPRVWNKLREEIQQHKDEEITYELLNSLTYLKNVLRETNRLTTIVGLNQRICLNDVVLPRGGGPDGNSPFHVRKGDVIEVDYGTMMRDPSFWGEEADKFVPERWETIRPTWEYTPFGGGPRACPGMRLVFTECAYTIVRIMKKFKYLENRDEELEWKERVRLTMESKNGAQVGLIVE